MSRPRPVTRAELWLAEVDSLLTQRGLHLKADERDRVNHGYLYGLTPEAAVERAEAAHLCGVAQSLGMHREKCEHCASFRLAEAGGGR